MCKSRKILAGTNQKVAQFNVLLELQLKKSFWFPKLPMWSANSRGGQVTFGEVLPPLAPPKSACSNSSIKFYVYTKFYRKCNTFHATVVNILR